MATIPESTSQSVTIPDIDRGPSRRSRLVVAGLAAVVPLLWVPLTLLHPDSRDLVGESDTWLGVHYAQLALTPLLGLGMLQVLHGLSGPAAPVGRIAVVLWLALFSAFDSIAGITTGVLARGGYDEAATYLFDHGLVGGGSVLGWLAQPMWIVVAIASGLALRANGATVLAWASMLGSVLFALHAGWPPAVGLIALAMALWTTLSTRSEAA
jgi:hypothetical protein